MYRGTVHGLTVATRRSPSNHHRRCPQRRSSHRDASPARPATSSSTADWSEPSPSTGPNAHQNTSRTAPVARPAYREACPVTPMRDDPRQDSAPWRRGVTQFARGRSTPRKRGRLMRRSGHLLRAGTQRRNSLRGEQHHVPDPVRQHARPGPPAVVRGARRQPAGAGRRRADEVGPDHRHAHPPGAWASSAGCAIDLHAETPTDRVLPAGHAAGRPRRATRNANLDACRDVRHEGRRVGARPDRPRACAPPTPRRTCCATWTRSASCRSVVLPFDLPVGARNADHLLEVARALPRAPAVRFGAPPRPRRRRPPRPPARPRARRASSCTPTASSSPPTIPGPCTCAVAAAPTACRCCSTAARSASNRRPPHAAARSSATSGPSPRTPTPPSCSATPGRCSTTRPSASPTGTRTPTSSCRASAWRRCAQVLDAVPADRMLYGTDWPFYHQALTLARVLIATEGDRRAAPGGAARQRRPTAGAGHAAAPA